MCSPVLLPADAASLGSVDRYTPHGPVAHRIAWLAAVRCLARSLVHYALADGAARVCTLVLSSWVCVSVC